MNKQSKLAVYSLFIHPYDLGELDNPFRLFDEPAPASLKIDQKYDIYIQFRGHHTRNLPKKSYFVELEFPRRLYDSRDFHLNAEYFDPSFIRNKLSLDLFQHFGTLAPTSQHIQLFLNDQYQGIYLHLESVDDLFFKKRGLPSGSIYYAVNNDANFSLNSYFSKVRKKSLLRGYQLKLGTDSDNKKLKAFIKMISKTPSAEFEEEIVKFLDVEKYLRWLAVAVCTQNLDGFLHNYALYGNSETGQFEIIPWDYDASFGRDWNGDYLKYDALSIKGYNTLTKKLLEVPNFRKHYQQLLEELLTTLFTPSFIEPIILSLFKLIRPHLLIEKANQLEKFDAEKEFIIQFIKDRNSYLSTQLSSLD